MKIVNKYADIILPIPLPKLFTFGIPDDLLNVVKPGIRVVVQFGKKKIHSGIVFNVHNNAPENYEIKFIIEVLENYPVVNSFQLKLWKWIADYYMCSLGEVYKAALPSGLKLESETIAFLNNDFDENIRLTGIEEKIYTLLNEKKTASLQEISSALENYNIVAHVNSLVNKNVLITEEKLSQSYKPKTEIFLDLPEDFAKDKNKLHEIFDSLKKANKQLELFMQFLQLTGIMQNDNPKSVSRKNLLNEAGADSAMLKNLVKKGFIVEKYVEVDRMKSNTEAIVAVNELNTSQIECLEDVKQKFTKQNVVLLHGVTSSGKTEIYINLIQQVIERGGQVLYLLPEIALTAQIINRLTLVFGEKVGIYHSKYSDSERVEVYKKVLNCEKYSLVLGVRSSVFLPFSNLQLVIIDEEHENSYKQFDPSPRYHARDTAIVLASMHNAKVLLGTATPSIESYFNAKIEKFALTNLKTRYLDILLPEIEIVDTGRERRRKKMHSHFSEDVIENIKTVLEQGEQVILFQNRRGFSPYLECSLCGWVPKCKHCDVSLTYHKFTNTLVCHYCGYSVDTFSRCLACEGISMETKGFGTEKIEEEMAIFFPEAGIARMDLDTTRTRKAYEKIITDFEEKKTNILIGTQMITKGLDFDNVSLVVILNADNLLNFPDFRAFERAFQLMSQVSGRAGRKNKRGKVIIQTTQPTHTIIRQVINNDYLEMFNNQLLERKNFAYPPFFKLIKITIKHQYPNVLNSAAIQMGKMLRSFFGKRILGPEDPVINRVQNKYLKTILIKIEKEKAGKTVKDKLQEIIDKIKMHPDYRMLIVSIDVDPM
ncbi:MAG: primosomal protein N' [Bacteroidales bacterium]|nr:primosomal protein N' [Bacteroidales bacterium]